MSKIILGSLLLIVALLFCLNPPGVRMEHGNPSSPSVEPHRQPRAEHRIDLHQLSARLPLSFEQNAGQLNAAAKFSSRGVGYNLFLTSTGAVLELRNANERTATASQGHASLTVLTLKVVGANSGVSARGLGQLPGHRNYLIGSDPKKWFRDVPTFRAVCYEAIYPGISLTYYGNRQQLEYDFVIAPGADPRMIRLGFNAGVRPQVSAEGDLLLRTGGGEVRQQKPVVYQDIGGHRQLVDGHYVLPGKRQVGFEIGPYDRSKPLVIDPTLVYSTYLGGSGDDLGSSIAIDSSNNVYILGTTGSTNFPLKDAAFGVNAGLSDIFVTKIDAAGANIIYSTYVGGSGLDRGDGIAVDSSGNAYVVGRVDSSSINFPTTPGALATTYRGGDFDGVVFKLNGQGNSLVYSTYLGGEENDSTEGVVVDSSGNAYVTGGTKSIGFPTSINAYQGTPGGDTDAFLSKLNATGTSLLYSTYLGGSGTDRGSGVAIDSNGNAYLAGFTGSSDFPTENAFQDIFGGSFDAFVAKIDTKVSGLASLVSCSYLGGIADDKAYGIALDSSGTNLYVVGQTSSNNFPLLNPAQATSGGSFDAFIAKITSRGVKVYATYLGGNGDDRGTGIAVNSAGEVYATGSTSSTNFPTVNPLQIAKGGGFDAFAAKLNSTGSALSYSTYLGGSGNESNTSTVTSTNPLALDSSNNAYITGFTSSNNFPTALPLQSTNAGGASDAFIAKISDNQPALFVANLNAAQEVPANNSTASGTATLLLSPDQTGARLSLNFSGLSSPESVAHIHGPGAPGENAPVLFLLPQGNVSDYLIPLGASDVQNLNNGFLYINVQSSNVPAGEIRGQFQTSPAASSLQFNTPIYSVSEAGGSAVISVNRIGNISTAATIDYTTSDGTASNRTDYITSSGTLHFAAGETMKTFSIPLVDDLYVEGNETLNLQLSGPSGGAFLGSPNSAVLTITDNDSTTPTTNPLDDAQFFVRQHYLDFLNREPEPGGFVYWTGQIANCGADIACINSRRIGVSGAFFVEPEFQESGSFIYRLYKGGLGRLPNYDEFSLDRSKVIGGPELEASKTAIANVFVQRTEFMQLYPDTLTNAAFVYKLFDTAGLVPFTGERQQEISALMGGAGRTQVVRDVIEIPAFKNREYNPSFVLMEYFGYLRRDQDPAGYAFWLDVITNREPNNYPGMICAFITSIEYQQRFSSVITHSNSECAGLH